MDVPDISQYSNKQFRRLGDRIRANPGAIADDDLLMLQSLRLSYKQPLGVIYNSIEKSARRVDKESICTYRVKRIESIISKLLRFPEMQVNRAEDIAGCRCIMSSTEKVYELFNKLMRNQDKLPYTIKGVIHDYIAEPKESGYRSIHINAVLKDGDNRRVEIQLRSLEHHNWATLVEITDLLFRTHIKEYGRKANDELFELHRLLSKPDAELSKSEKYRIADVAIKYQYINRLGEVFAQNYLDVREQWNKMRLMRFEFFLVMTGSDGVPDFLGYHAFDEAEKNYFEEFVNNTENRNIIMTHLQKASFTKISIAYSNYFLTFNNTLTRLLLYLSEATVNSYRQNKVRAFARYYESFLQILSFWYSKQLLEVEKFRLDQNVKKSLLLRTEWTSSINSGVQALQQIVVMMHRQLKFNPLYVAPYIIKKRLQNRYRRLYAESEAN